MIFSYFYDYLTVVKKGVAGALPTAMGQLLLAKDDGRLTGRA